MKLLFTYGLFFCPLLLAITLKGQDAFYQKLDSAKMTIGDQQYLTLKSSLQDPGDYLISILDTLQWFQMIDKGSWKPQAGFQERKILFTVFDSGYYKIPSLGIFKPDDTVALGHPLFIEVNNPVDSLSVLRPIKTIEETKEPLRFLYILSIGIIILIIMMFILWKFFTADQMRPVSFQMPIHKKVWESSLEELYQLEEKKLWQKNIIKPYYDEFNLILRKYISQGLKIPALESTTSEIISEFKTQFPDFPELHKLRQCFINSDYVKFANAVPDFKENEAWMQFAKEFIKSTKEQSEKILEEKRVHWKALLGSKISEQFEDPFQSVPNRLLQIYEPEKMAEFMLIRKLLLRRSFILPTSWVKLHLSNTGMFYRWHHTLLNLSENRWIQMALILFVLPFLAIFLPMIYLVSVWKKEALFTRGEFAISRNNKLVFTKEA